MSQLSQCAASLPIRHQLFPLPGRIHLRRRSYRSNGAKRRPCDNLVCLSQRFGGAPGYRSIRLRPNNGWASITLQNALDQMRSGLFLDIQKNHMNKSVLSSLSPERTCCCLASFDDHLMRVITSITLGGGKGGAGASSLHTTLEGPNRVCECKMDSYMTSNGSCFMVTWTIFKYHLLEVGLT